ncbi:MAG: hypothetical protein JRN15_08360 [Nitrososphaerota archaeon]|nr:hypothetical protein [Nitrososphaerota archaeon]
MSSERVLDREPLEEILIKRWEEVKSLCWVTGGKDTSSLDNFGHGFQWLCRFLPEEVSKCKNLAHEIYATLSKLREEGDDFDYFYWHRILPFELGLNAAFDSYSNEILLARATANVAAGDSGIRYYVQECVMWQESRISRLDLAGAVQKNVERGQPGHDSALLALAEAWRLFDKDLLATILKKDFVRDIWIEQFEKNGRCQIENPLLPTYLRGQEEAMMIIYQVLDSNILSEPHQQHLFIEHMPGTEELRDRLKKTKLNRAYLTVEM